MSTNILLRGLAIPEQGALWTEGGEAQFIFTDALPHKFLLRIKTNGAFGPNVGGVFTVVVDNIEREFIGPPGAKEVDLHFVLKTKTNSILIITPRPTSPFELGATSDSRKLGLSIRGLDIIAE